MLHPGEEIQKDGSTSMILASSRIDARLTLRVSLLVVAHDRWIIGRCRLESDWLDAIDEEKAWSLALPRFEWASLIWSWTHAPSAYLQVVVENEHLLADNA